MRDHRITLLKIENDSNAPEDPSLAPMVLSETTGGANVEPNLSARKGSRRWNAADSEPVRRSLPEASQFCQHCGKGVSLDPQWDSKAKSPPLPWYIHQSTNLHPNERPNGATGTRIS